jgi:hypothetical protein
MAVVLLLDTSAPVATACDVFCFLLDDEGGGLPSFEGQSILVEIVRISDMPQIVVVEMTNEK